jgi:nitroimidazol reductase NimA-like FMN-containing flavoprotein (pyridoxamine 5'-phosphate oxidase superfamily)
MHVGRISRVTMSGGGTEMMIHEMTRQACVDLLARMRMGRLACAYEGQPYITPMNCAYGDGCLYGFSRAGQKIDWMRANPLVCVEVDEMVSEQDWATVVVLGRYEELADTPQNHAARQRAHELLQRRPMWWEPGSVATHRHEKERAALHDKEQPTALTYFRIHVDKISGHRGVPDVDQELSARHAGPAHWLRRILKRQEHQKAGPPFHVGPSSPSAAHDRKRH